MFGKKTPPQGLTYISEHSTITGEVTLSGEVMINGTLEGNLHCEGDVTLGKSGKILGTLQAHKVFNAGLIDGTANCILMHIENKGIVKGELDCEEIKIDRGGQFFGTRKPVQENNNIVTMDASKEKSSTSSKDTAAAANHK